MSWTTIIVLEFLDIFDSCLSENLQPDSAAIFQNSFLNLLHQKAEPGW